MGSSVTTVNEAARTFVAVQTAAADAAFFAAFKDGYDEAYDELAGDADEPPPRDWEALLARHSSERARIFAFYLPALNKMAGEITAIAGSREAAIQSFLRDGYTREQAAQMPSVLAHDTALRKALDSIKTRLKQLFDGLTWAAAELARGALAADFGRSVSWVLDPRAAHCATCPALAHGSPYRSVAAIGTVPGLDGTDCRSQCRCHLEFD